MADTKSISVRLRAEQYFWLQEIANGGPIATEIKNAIDFYIEAKEMIWLKNNESSASSASSANGTLFVTTILAAKFLGISPRGLRKKIKKGEIKAIKPGKNWLIFASEIPNLLRPRVTEMESNGTSNNK